MTRAFRVCFFLHMIQFMLSTFLGPFFEILQPFRLMYENSNGKKSLIVVMMAEHFLRGLTLIVIIWQWLLLTMTDNAPCFNNSDNGLELEHRWMWILMGFQLILSVLFTFWRLNLLSFDKIIDKLRMDQFTLAERLRKNTLKREKTTNFI